MIKLLTILLLAGTSLSGISDTHTDAEIYAWIKNRMGITEQYAMPTVMHVPQAVIATIWWQKASKYYPQWVKEIGEEAADERVSMYIREIRGLFSGEDMTVLYITSDTNTSIYREAIVAHELGHFLQEKSRGVAYTDEEHFFREMEMTKYEKEYIKEFCPKCDEMGEIITEVIKP